MARGEDFVGGGVAGGFELFVEVGAAAYPAHEVVHGGARVALGEIELCEGALGVGSDLESIHGSVCFFLSKRSFRNILNNRNYRGFLLAFLFYIEFAVVGAVVGEGVSVDVAKVAFEPLVEVFAGLVVVGVNVQGGVF